MKIDWKTCFRICLSVFLLFLCIHYWGTVSGFIALVFGAATPLFVGCIIAYILNILMDFYERHYFTGRSSDTVKKSRRPVCLLASLLTLIVIVVLLINMVIPQLVSCIKLLVSRIPDAMEMLSDSKLLSEIIPNDLMDAIASIDWQSRISQIFDFLSTGISGTVGTVAGIVSAIVSSVVTWVIGFVFALYLLVGKEKIQGQFLRLMHTYLRPLWIDKIMYVARVFNDCFHRYIVGQCIEAVILGSLCALGMLLFRIPYAVMIGVLIGFTALIPIAGAYIGAGVGAFMILTVSPAKALLFLIFIVVLQQIEGNLIYPKVVGTSIRLPGIWVLAAVTVGGSLSGILGMLVGVPLAAALYQLIRMDVNRRNAVKGPPQN